jgi:hypothetical protein
MHARLYKEMGLTATQKQRMAEYWIQWERRRRELDAQMAAARAQLGALPASPDLPPAFLKQLAALADPCCRIGAPAAPAAVHGVDLSACEPVFVGQQAAAMAGAHGAVRALWAAHLQDRDMYLVNLDAQMPGVFITPQQGMRMWSEYLMDDVAPADFLSLCQLAATQQFRRALFNRQ